MDVGSMHAVLRTLAVAFAALIAVGALVSGAFGFVGRGGSVNVASAWPTFLTGVACATTVVAYLRRIGLWWGFGIAGAVGHVWAHVMALAHVRGEANLGRLIGLFTVPMLWILLVVAMVVLRPPKVVTGA